MGRRLGHCRREAIQPAAPVPSGDGAGRQDAKKVVTIHQPPFRSARHHDGSGSVRPEIAKSWKRCELIGVSPSGLEPSYDDVDGESRLVRAARVVLDRLAAELDDTRTCVILADADARIVERRLGMSSLSRGLDRVSALPGVLYDEACAGTNGLGTVVEERRPVAVRGTEHFAEPLKSFTCVGVPLVHPISGVLEGILDLTCLASESNELMLPLLLEASRDVRERFVADSSPSEQALLASFLRATRRTRQPVVCLNEQVVISNDAARGLAPADYALLWQHFAAGAAEGLVTSVELSEGRVYDARFGTVETGSVTAGAIVELRPPSRRRAAPSRAAPRREEPGTALVGHSRAWRRVLGEIELHAGHDQPVLVSGPRGVGKLRCAAAIHAGGGRSSQRVVVLDAALSVVDLDRQWITPLRAALSDPAGTVVLRHLEALHDQAALVTAALLDGVGPDGPRLLGTVTDPFRLDADLGALIDRFDVTMAVPPLSSRPEDVVDLFRAFAEQHGDAHWSGSATPEVLRALMRYPWPGNAREIGRVVRAVLLRRPNGQLSLDDLPPEIRIDAPPPGLSPIAAMERQAILEALRDAAGNKQAAAERLGVSRSTLYRKLSVYSI
jgi:transcriptional regulator of acetoin/glycerol metabolism